MTIHTIDGFALYFKKDGFHTEKAGSSYHPMVSLLNSNGEILAAINFSYSDEAWHVKGVVASNGYGPTIYQLLMQLAGHNGLAPCFKHGPNSKEFIVEKCKNIWKKFYESPLVRTVKLSEKYSESHLNYKFILKEDFFDLAKAFKRLELLIIESYINQLNPWQRTKLCITKKIDNNELEKFKSLYTYRIEADIVEFLNPSIAVHAKF
jgi:hypothetical protein